MKRLERLVAINDMLRRASPARVSAARLAEQLGVSRRTIERDLAALRAAGVPLYAEPGRNGGQISLEQGGAVVVTLSPSEVLALLVAVAAAGPSMPFADAGDTAVSRLLDGLPPSTRVAADVLRQRIRTKATTAGATSRRVRRTVETAVEQGRVVNIEYCDSAGASTRRAVDAVGFHHSDAGWYLIGWCNLRKAGRVFRLDRIVSARLTRTPIADHDVDETLGWIPHETTTP